MSRRRRHKKNPAPGDSRPALNQKTNALHAVSLINDGKVNHTGAGM